MSGVQAADWRALGTSVHLLVTDGELEPARRAVADLLDEVDRAYSRFRPDSELSRLNAAGGQPMAVSPLFGTAIETALRAGRLSDGLVDPTVGRAMRAVGYDADFSRVAARGEPLTLRLEPIPGWQAVRYDASHHSVTLARGVELDLGSTGKALAADLCAAAALTAMGRGGVLVSLGGDIATAGDPPDGGWRVLAADDSSTPADADGEVVAIRGGALATSGTTSRRWTRGGVTLHHLIDPRTGLPAEGPWRTASVVAATCVDANIAATAAIVRGRSAVPWLEGLGMAARLVSSSGQVVRLAGWPTPLAGMAAVGVGAGA
ncbi:MAG TPA: FAD:protein FMN transferase [Candidatus Limnocylindrales bacterium]